MTALFGLYTLMAAFAEELVFRGYLVVANRGRPALIFGIVGASLAICTSASVLVDLAGLAPGT
jgi:membrane protease YdiL (CAAX protease family)